VLIVFGSCATGKRVYVVEEDKELFGTWINTDYDDSDKIAMFILEPDGSIQVYEVSTSTADPWNNTYKITEKWIDDEGNIWYTYLDYDSTQGAISDLDPNYTIVKISDSGRVLELSFSSYDYPTELSPDSLKFNYQIYYRQE
jgi:hypothetical protein